MDANAIQVQMLNLQNADLNGDQWRTQAFRQKVIQKIDEVVLQTGNKVAKTSGEMEEHVFTKARTKDEYLVLVAKLILHVREINSKKEQKNALLIGGPGMPQANVQDPINALQNMTQQGMGPGMAGQGMPMRQMRPQMPGMQNMMQRGPQPGHQGPYHEMGMMHPHYQMGGTQQGPRPDGFIPGPGMNQVPMPNQVMPGMLRPGPPHYGSPGQMPQQTVQQVQITQVMNPQMGGQQMPSPATMYSQPNQSPGNMPTPSPQSQPVRSPASRASTIGAPSPGSVNLNTPGNPSSIGPPQSPRNASEADQAYLEKLKQLSKYIEPLKRMVARLDKEDADRKDWNKMKNLYEILSDSNRRVPMATLLKCEMVLEKMDLHPKPSAGSSSTTTTAPATAVSRNVEQHMFQPLIDAIAGHLKSPMLNHTLYRTFGPAVQALHGTPIRAPSPPPKRRKTETPPPKDKEIEIPDVLQGEVARLEQCFKVTLDPAQHSKSKEIHMICRLDDKFLPSVPPISVIVPEDYPYSSPKCDTGNENYECTEFLRTLHEILTSRLDNMPGRYSVSVLLNTWEMSVRQACAPSAGS